MSGYKLPNVSTIPSLPATDRAAILDHLFEPCVPLHTLSVGLLHDQTFESYHDCIASIGVQLTDLAGSRSTSDTQWLNDILGAHPKLGEKKIASTQSQAEQSQLASMDNVDDDKLAEHNVLYERTFPGLRYVVFVNGRDRAAILQDMQARIARGDLALERIEAIKAMCEIAADRARKLQS